MTTSSFGDSAGEAPNALRLEKRNATGNPVQSKARSISLAIAVPKFPERQLRPRPSSLRADRGNEQKRALFGYRELRRGGQCRSDRRCCGACEVPSNQ